METLLYSRKLESLGCKITVTSSGVKHKYGMFHLTIEYINQPSKNCFFASTSSVEICKKILEQC